MENRTYARRLVIALTILQLFLCIGSFFKSYSFVGVVFLVLSLTLTFFLFFILTRNIIFDVQSDINFKFLNVVISGVVFFVFLIKNIEHVFR